MTDLQLFEADRDLSAHEGIVYTFMTDRGRFDISYSTYLKAPNLRAMINDRDRYLLVLGRTIFSYSPHYLTKHQKIKKMMGKFEREKRMNPLRFFAPSGKAALDFLNDEENDVCILTAPNRAGKTQTMIIKKLINIIPCNSRWEIFSKYGVKHRKWRGPKKCGLATYELASHSSTLLPMLLDWIPENELGIYSREYKGRGKKTVSLRDTDPKLKLGCGSEIGFFTVSQAQARFESNVIDDWGWDEQGDEDRFDGADERTRTTPGGGRHDFGLTPHKIAGRPDTGAGSWIEKLVSGEQNKGRKIGKHNMGIYDVPDWIFAEDSKLIGFKKHILEPARTKNIKAEREGLSRYRGKFHEASGLVIDEWDSKKHVIEPFEIPSHWPRFRAVDHGDKHPAAAIWAAISPAGDLFIYRDYLRTGRVPSQICKDIIELSGNQRDLIGSYSNPRNDMIYSRYKEHQTGERYQWTVFDARAFSTNSADSGLPLAKIYGFAGLQMKKGSGHNSEHYVPLIKEWFVLDQSKKHFVTREDGAPRLYVFATCTDFIRTVKRWVWVDRKTSSADRLSKESPTKKDDDLMDCCKILLQANPRYRGAVKPSDGAYYEDIDESEQGKLITNVVIDPITGY